MAITGTIEIFAAIVIILSIIKLVILAIKPEAWMQFAKNFYGNPKLLSFIALILSIVVLYYLLGAGITIIEIFAVMLFFMLIVVAGMAHYVKHLLRDYDLKKAMKNLWLYTLVWVVLIAWGFYELFIV